MDLFHIFDRGIRRSTAAIKQSQDTDGEAHNNFVRLLSVAMLLKVNLLPLTWSPALEGLGSGATAQISQFSLNVQTTFAFKRFNHINPNSDLSDEQFLNQQYNALIAEIIALSSPHIYNHPNIVNLEGISWEILDDSVGVFPVLVFRRAECGDLRRFLSSPEAVDLSFDDRLAICVEVVRALKIMHECGRRKQY